MSITSIITATAVDPEMQTAIASIQSGHWEKRQPYYSVREELTVTPNRLLLRGTKLIIPTKLRNETITHAHKGHQGIVKTKQALRTKVWWLRIDKDAEQFIKHCHACQSLGHGDPLTSTTTTPTALQTMGQASHGFLWSVSHGGNTACRC